MFQRLAELVYKTVSIPKLDRKLPFVCKLLIFQTRTSLKMSLPPLPKLRPRPGLKPAIDNLPPDISITTTGGVDDDDELDNVDEVSILQYFT